MNRFGQGKLSIAAQRYNPERPMKSSYLSLRYTTEWNDIITAN
ncbi:DUF4113 domain-containing protein [Spirosoma lituiforme]